MGAAPLPKDSASNLSIGQVLAKLSIEFPELSSSKIRFLEDQGLVLPERSAGGYRTYTLPLVERIRVVLSLQRDHFRLQRDSESPGGSQSLPLGACSATTS